jgi:hypothetical protein
MSVFTYTDPNWNGLKLVTELPRGDDQKERILATLGPTDDRLPVVDDDTLHEYYEYLSANLSLPFTAHYPKPMNPREEVLHECTVLGLFDPSKCVNNEIDGIFCRTQKAEFEVNLPLVELDVPKGSFNFQMIEDYWDWFWNWRCVR